MAYDWTGYEDVKPEEIKLILRENRNYRMINDKRCIVHDRHLKNLEKTNMSPTTPGTGMNYPGIGWVWGAPSIALTIWQLQDDNLWPVGLPYEFDEMNSTEYNQYADLLNILLKFQQTL